MGSAPTALERVDGVLGELEAYFENPSASAVFRDSHGKYLSGPARIITRSFVAGLKPREFKSKIEGVLDMRAGWKTDPDQLFDIAREAAIAWRTVEQADRIRGAGRGKPGSGSSSNKSVTHRPSPQSQDKPSRSSGREITCFVCGEVGHKAPKCTASVKHGSSKKEPVQQSSPARPSGKPPAKGTPAARGGSQSRPSAQTAPAGGAGKTGSRAVLSAASASETGADARSLPPDRICG